MARSSRDPVACPDDGALRRLLEADVPEVLAHLDQCETCRGRLDALAGSVPVAGNGDDTERSEALETAMRRLRVKPRDAAVDMKRWLEPADDPELLGKLGGYHVRNILAEGGMGVVLKAYDPVLDRDVAIKFIKPHHATGQTARERMLREARAVARIQHESVVPIYGAEIHEASGAPYFVMPLVVGGTLEGRMAEGEPLALTDILSIGTKLARGLEAAHVNGVLHRDIKPANILLPGEERVWLADFGIARATDDQRLTGDGELPGTPQFMAPEQIEGRLVDHRADLFSLGAVLYQMATGAPAFGGDSSLAVIRAVADHEHVPAQKANRDLPAWLAELIDALLAKDPDRRPQTAAEVARAMETHSRLGRHVKWYWWGAAALALVVTLVLMWKPKQQEGSWKNSAFTLPNQECGFDVLSRAIEAAEPGGLVVIRRDGIVHSGVLPPIVKPLTIQAAVGVRPEIRCLAGATPVLQVDAPLRIEGVGIVLSPSVEGKRPTMIRATAPLAVANCTFIRGTRSSRKRGNSSALLQLSAPANVINCAFLTSDVRAIGVHGAADVALENSFIVARVGFDVRSLSDPDAESSRITLRRSLFVGHEFLRCNDDTMRPLSLDLSHTVIDATKAVLVLPSSESLETLNESFGLREDKNLYSNEITSFVHFGPVNRGVSSVETFGEWSGLWGTEGSGSASCPMDLRDRIAGLLSQTGSDRTPDTLAVSEEVANRFPDRGPDAMLGGAGKPYERFRASPAYEEWLVAAEKMLSAE